MTSSPGIEDYNLILPPVPSSGATGQAQRLGKIAILGQSPSSPGLEPQ